jgi:uncharacterized membrane protein
MTKKIALIESIVNVTSGLLLSVFVVQPIVFNWFDISLPMHQNVYIAVIFTVVSIARGYVWRRWFHKKFYEGKY